ncbi:peptide ABC transporter substrate-binding protein [Thalassospira sp. HJ]|uniref:ABC transporter substrate-binding protein n=1 Tax=Thalassospira sp. HJ TaxID=1616823 RepID=UPI0005CEB142|nr:ABC transporter substrate-binding protein [Thalassospira sp. HJ]KJE34952.1 peptide ABC transporter substrate-binding protein [Thalassospira sp. HJ]
MIKKTLLGAAFAALAMGSFALAPQPAQATEDNTLVIGTMWESMPLAMKPRRSRFFNESEILDTLVKLDYDLKTIPGLATEWDRVSPTVWQFKLRENVIFHDGTKLDAEAVKFSLERVIDLLPYAADLLNIKSIKAISPLVVEIENTEPFAALPNQLSDAITVVYAKSSFDEAGEFVKPIGTGPWKFEEYKKQDRTIVTRFDDYWGEKPALEKVVYRYIPDHNSRTLALEAGEIDFVTNMLPSDVKRLSEDDDFKVYAEPTSGLYYGAFNAGEKSVLSDVRIRRAVNALVDRDLIVKGALDDVGEPAWEFFAPSFDWAPQADEKYTLDPELAASLLSDAGYEKTDGKWMKDGEQLTLRILSYSSRTEMPMITEAMAALLNEQGIATEVGMYTWGGMLDLVKQGEYDVSVVFWTPEMTGHPDLHLKSQFHSKAGLNYQFWANEEFDAAVDKGRTLDPGAEQVATYTKAMNILHDEAPIIPLVHKVFVVASTKELQNYRIHPSGFFFDFKSVSK